MRIHRLAAILVTAVLVAACGSGTAGQTTEKKGGTLTTAIGVDVDTLDPQAQVTTQIMQLDFMMVETLTTLDQSGNVKPGLASKWDVSPDGLNYTFTLRSGVKFSDGEPFNATAVKFAIDRLLDPKTFKAQPGPLRVIASVTPIDDTHVKFTLKNPFAPFPAALFLPNAGFISPKSVNQAPNTPEKIAVPVGTGPYIFKDRVPGDHVTFTSNPSYWGKKPSYQTQVYKVIPEASAREAALRSGQADVIVLPPATDLPALKSDKAYSVELADTSYIIQMMYNTDDANQPLLKNKQVRQALQYAVDRDTLMKSLLYGTGAPVDAPLPKTVYGYCSVGSYPYDPSKAKSMLAAAGASNMALKMVAPNGRYVQDFQVAQAVAGMLRQVGLKVDMPNPPDWPTYLSQLYVTPDKANADIRMIGWGSLYLDASQQLIQFQGDYLPPGGLNASYYSNPQFDSLVKQGNSAVSDSQRKDYYCQAQKLLWDESPTIWLYSQKNPIVSSSKVKGVYGLPNLMFVTTWATPA